MTTKLNTKLNLESLGSSTRSLTCSTRTMESTTESLAEKEDASDDVQHQERLKERTVNFDERCRVRPIKSVKNMSQKIIQEAWYSREEMQLIKKECKQTIRFALQKGENIGSYQLNTRGLETFHPRKAKRRERRRRDAWDVVLGEQVTQKQNGSEDANFIAELCHELNKNSIKDALARAKQDRQDCIQLEKSGHIFPSETQLKLISLDQIKVRRKVPERRVTNVNISLQLPIQSRVA